MAARWDVQWDVHEDMGGKGSTQESALSLGDQKDTPLRREELTQTKG